jgi:hypothetical protein
MWLGYPGAINRFSISDSDITDQDTHTMSPRNLGLGKFWYEQCLHTHKRCCQLTRDPSLPLLVLDIADEKRPHLAFGQNRCAQYATLSYKWGEGKRLLTTTENYARFQLVIDTDELPKTFSDTILVARQLGFDFLWIDALCMRHDIMEEVNEQIAMMDSVYAMSSLTIFAAWGGTAHSGLSVPRDPWLIKPSELVIKAAWRDQQQQRTIYFNEWTDNSNTPPLHEVVKPLYGRGWVLQEQVLSLRGLVFNGDYVSWQCLTLRNSSSEALPIGALLDDQRYLPWKFNPVDYGSWLRSTNILPRNTILAAWYPLIEDFSGRDLTYELDTLPALSGLASQISRLYKCSYLAGLWQEDIQYGLLWTKETWESAPHICSPAQTSPKEADDVNNASKRPSFEDTRALEMPVVSQVGKSVKPSWSWISSFGNKGLKFKLHPLRMHRDLDEKHVFEVLDVAITQATGYTNPFGKLESAILTIEAFVKPAKIKSGTTNQAFSSDGPTWHNLYDPSGCQGESDAGIDEDPIGEFRPDDTFLLSDEGNSILCVLCVREHPEFSKFIDHCLAVVPADEPGQYFRVGLAVLFSNHQFDAKTGEVTQEDVIPDQTRILKLI